MGRQIRAAGALELAKALLENGDSLLDDAEVLFEAERPARAVALSLIATEELGKIYLCLGGITGEAEIPGATSRKWRNHRDKLETARALELAFVDHLPEFDLAKIKAEIDWQLQVKMSALYVDHDNGQTRRPSDLDAGPRGSDRTGPREERRTVLHNRPNHPEVLDAMDEHGALMSRIAEALIDDGDPAATVERLRAVTAAAVGATRRHWASPSRQH